MSENCPQCGSVAQIRSVGVDYYECGTTENAAGIVRTETCQLRATRAELAALLAELAVVERELMLPDGSHIDTSTVGCWLRGLVERRASSLDPTYSALRAELTKVITDHEAALLRERSLSQKLSGALEPFATMGIPPNWPGQCKLRVDTRDDGSEYVSYHGEPEAHLGILPTIDDWKRAAKAAGGDDGSNG